MALDLRAQIAGNVTASRRITKLIERYGPDVVKGVMRKIIDTAEAAFLQKMAKLPDGIFRERTYVEVARVGDRSTYQVLLTMEKRGDQLVFDNAGTAASDGGHQHDLFGLARLDPHRRERAPVLGPALRHRRGPAPHPVPAGPRGLHLAPRTPPR